MGRVSSRSHANPERSSGQCGAMLPPPPYLTGPLCRQPLGAGSGPSSPPAPLLRHQTLGGGKGPTGGASSPAGPAAPPGPRPGGGEPSQAQPPAPLRTREIPRQLPAGDKSTGGERGGRDGSRSTSAASTSHEPAPPPRPPPGRRSLPGRAAGRGAALPLRADRVRGDPAAAPGPRGVRRRGPALRRARGHSHDEAGTDGVPEPLRTLGQAHRHQDPQQVGACRGQPAQLRPPAHRRRGGVPGRSGAAPAPHSPGKARGSLFHLPRTPLPGKLKARR
ncbi:collagen alpha-1(I) chain-like isoform X5 [Aquila chrysaetos chrysaetos]|uniref:collagen alpha-1(I) chain-like isoform X5 n=1 Tax=Aquila chrysaetos chrysaetos TaxID=223781 RepID=UPI001B7D34F6|nr:collagen alpha-1(I) chain-like isoform X5 [Aquila chrysaetos chrysaetos]